MFHATLQKRKNKENSTRVCNEVNQSIVQLPQTGSMQNFKMANNRRFLKSHFKRLVLLELQVG